MKGYKTIEDYTFDECLSYMERFPDGNNIQEVTDRYNELLQKLRQDDDAMFADCRTITDFEQYINHYAQPSSSSRYEPQHLDEARGKVEYLYFETCKTSIKGCSRYLQKYPSGQFADRALANIRQYKKSRGKKIITYMSLAFLFAAIVTLFNYNPVTYLNVPSQIQVSKLGDSLKLNIDTDGYGDMIDITTDDDWIKIIDDFSPEACRIKVIPNKSEGRTGQLTVHVTASLFGRPVGSAVKDSIIIEQESGLPTFLNISQKEIKFKNTGSSQKVVIKTDGVALSVKRDSRDGWLNYTVDTTYHADYITAEINISAGINDGKMKQGEIYVNCGKYNQIIFVEQESGLANYFDVESENLTIPEKGTSSGMCYPIDVRTDGVSWSVMSAPYWLTATADLIDSRLEVQAGPNAGQIKQGEIKLGSNNGHIRTIKVIQQGDPSNFRASKYSLQFDVSSDDEYVYIYNDSDKSLSVSEFESWLKASVIDKNRIKISCYRNYDNPPRSANVYVKCGDSQLVITAKQAGWKKCSRCDGTGEIDCPNAGQWANGLEMWMYGWVNGRHVLRHVYSTYTGWMGAPVPQYDDSICSKCDGDGTIECTACDGKGKIKESY